jgi:hypothetical protein
MSDFADRLRNLRDAKAATADAPLRAALEIDLRREALRSRGLEEWFGSEAEVAREFLSAMSRLGFPPASLGKAAPAEAPQPARRSVFGRRQSATVNTTASDTGESPTGYRIGIAWPTSPPSEPTGFPVHQCEYGQIQMLYALASALPVFLCTDSTLRYDGGKQLDTEHFKIGWAVEYNFYNSERSFAQWETRTGFCEMSISDAVTYLADSVLPK